MTKFIQALAIFFNLVSLDATSIVDLDLLSDDFVLETKQIIIEKYPDAFNPSIIRWEGDLLLSFRIRDPLTFSTDKIGFVWLDEDFNPQGAPYILDRRNENLTCPSWAQDPRLLTAGGIHYIVFNNMVNVKGVQTRRMIVSPLQFDGINFYTETYDTVLNFEGESSKVLEKNWVPFDFSGHLLLSYSLNPHRVEMPIFGTNGSVTQALTSQFIDFDWGELRGGTPALLDGDRYLAFFHTATYLSSVQSDGKKLLHYFMGAYTFSKEPPFNLLSISQKPIIDKAFYNGPMYKTWKPLRCVFPCGIIISDLYVWVTYGRQDHESWVVKFDKEKLFKSLKELAP